LAFRKDDMFDEYNVKAGTIDWYTKNKRLLDKSVPEIIIADKTVGDSLFQVYRNESFELVFIHRIGSVVRKAAADLNKVDYYDGIRVQLTWGPDESYIKVGDTTLEQNYFIVKCEEVK